MARKPSFKIGLFKSLETRVTYSNPFQSRSESDIAINPLDDQNIVGTSKKFYNPQKYHFVTGVYSTQDGGKNWYESTLQLKAGWESLTDPVVCFDNNGVAMLFVSPNIYNDQDVMLGQGIYLYRSHDGGRTWDEPKVISDKETDDKEWATVDSRSSSPFKGRRYAVWGVNKPCGFSMSPNGKDWYGENAATGFSNLHDMMSWAPVVVTDSKGWVHVFDYTNGGFTEIRYKRSKDGGHSFEPLRIIATGLKGYQSFPLSLGGSFKHFPGGKFRISTMMTATCAAGQTLIMAWPDTREGEITRIYFRISYDGGENWEGQPSGQPLLPNADFGDSHCFMPQLAGSEGGKIGCAFYTFGRDGGSGKFLINVYLAATFNNNFPFTQLIKVNDDGWDPLVNAPFAHGNPEEHFIGDYFGLDVSSTGNEFFGLLWTDTSTGVQELIYSRIDTAHLEGSMVDWLPMEITHKRGTTTILRDDILIGGLDDGPIYILKGGAVVPVGPHSPHFEMLETIAMLEQSEFSSSDLRRETRNLLLKRLKVGLTLLAKRR